MLRVLGVVEADGVVVRSAAQRTILSALALDLGAVVSVDRLVDLVWGEELPANPSASLQNHISRLRRTLGDAGEIAAIGTGYRLEVPPDGLDVEVFEDSFRRACANRDDPDLIGRAIDSWRGRPYVDLDDPRATAEVARLEEMHAALHELRADAWLRARHLSEAIAELEELRHRYPLRERCVELLMHAYVEAGRKSDALAAYRQLRVALVDELGLDPSPALRELEVAIITEERVATPRPGPAAGTAHIDEAGPDDDLAPTSPVPLPTSSFFGRDDLVVRVAAVVGANRIVTLVGPGGVGKTRLALHVANEAADRFSGVTVVELAALRAADQLSGMVAGALGLRPRPEVTDEERIVDAIGSRSHLLVLDNCEHVIEAVADLIAAIAPRVPNLVVMSTSREPLGVDGEHVVRLKPLDVKGAATDLFVARARAAGSDLELDVGRRELVEQICAALDGLPLAIELAASRCGTMSLEDIAASLGEPLALQRRRAGGERHGSLRALVAWSARDLDADLTDVFVRTSLFAGPFTAAGAAEVAGMPVGTVAPALADLAERSLLVAVPNAGPQSTYRFLETIRAYAHAELQERPEAEQVAERHADWVLALVEASEAALVESSPVQPDVRVLSRIAELRVVHRRFSERGDVDRAVRFAAALHFVAMFHMQPEVFGWIRDTAEQFGDSGHPSIEDVLASASIGSWQSGDLAAADRYARLAHDASKRSDAVEAGRGAAEALADVTQFGGDNAAGLEHFEAALSIARAGGNTLRVISNLADSAMVAGYMGDVERARRHIEAAKAMLGDRGAQVLWAWIHYAEGEALAEHDPRAALAALSTAIDLARRVGADFIIGVAGLTRTGLQVRSGDPHDAVPGVIELVEHWRRSGAWVQQWITQRTVVELFVALDELHHAAVVLGAVLDSGSATEAAGPDAERLVQARAFLQEELPQAEEALRHGAALAHDDLIDSVLARLGDLTR